MLLFGRASMSASLEGVEGRNPNRHRISKATINAQQRSIDQRSVLPGLNPSTSPRQVPKKPQEAKRVEEFGPIDYLSCPRRQKLLSLSFLGDIPSDSILRLRRSTGPSLHERSVVHRRIAEPVSSSSRPRPTLPWLGSDAYWLSRRSACLPELMASKYVVEAGGLLEKTNVLNALHP
jgi:hypothetical protein